MREVSRLVAAPGVDDRALEDRLDLPLVTIDDATSRDLDQAVCVERDGEDYVVWYALADAAHFVRPGSELYAEALRRGASFYLPDLMIPMLPRALSEGIVSLNPDVERRALLFRIELNRQGALGGTTVSRARVRSRAKLSFEGVQRFLDSSDPQGFDDDAIATSLRLLHEVGRVRVADAEERDIVHYRRQEVKTHLGPGDGLAFLIGKGLRMDVERDNEQISLLCNMEGARILRDGDRGDDEIHPIYRVHAAPPRDKIAHFEQFLVALAKSHGLDAKRWTWRQSGKEALSTFLERLPSDGAEGRIAQAIHRQAVLVNGRSVFRQEPGAHYGIGAEVYARFSAPMREMVGVFLHQEMWENLGEPAAPLPSGVKSGEELRDRIVARANEAKEIQKHITGDANRLVLDQLLEESRRTKHALEGTLVGLTPTKAHVLLDAPPIDLKVYLMDVPTPVKVDAGLANLRDASGAVHASVGDEVRLRVLGRDERRDRWRLDLERA